MLFLGEKTQSNLHIPKSAGPNATGKLNSIQTRKNNLHSLHGLMLFLVKGKYTLQKTSQLAARSQNKIVNPTKEQIKERRKDRKTEGRKGGRKTSEIPEEKDSEESNNK